MSSFTHSPKQPSSIGLSFDIDQRPTNLSQHLLKDRDDPFEADDIANDLAFVKNYRSGKLVIILKFAPGRGPRYFSLIFQAIPSLIRKPRSIQTIRNGEANKSATHSKWCDDFMFVGVTHLIQGPKKPIPSFVWFAFEHGLKNRFRDIPGSTLRGFRAFPQLTECIPKGEMGVVPSRVVSNGRGMASVVKRRAKTINGIKNNTGYFHRHRLNKLDLEYILMGTRVTLIDGLAGVTFNKRVDNPYQLVNTSLCVIDAVF